MAGALNSTNMTSNGTMDGYCVVHDVAANSNNMLMAVMYLITMSISTPGNILLIFVISKNEPMQTFTNCLICNSAVSDLISTIIPGVVNTIDAFNRSQGRWIFGEFMCKFLYICVYWSVSVTIISLTLIAVDRYCVIMIPQKKYLTTKMLRFIVPAIWILGFGFASPTVFSRHHIHENGNSVCLEKWYPPFDPVESRKQYIIVLFVFLYLIPLFVMAIIYTSVGRKLTNSIGKHQNAKLTSELKTSSKVSKRLMSVKEGSAALPTRKTSPSFGFNKQRVIRMLIIIVICFAICWLPVHVLQFFQYFHPYYIKCPHAIPNWVFVFAFFMYYGNGAVNPILYFTFSYTYRKGLKQSLRQ